MNEDHRDSPMEGISINPSLTLRELAEMLEGSFDVKVCQQTIAEKYKALHAERKHAMMNEEGRNDLTLTEYRVRYVENLIDDMIIAVTRQKCIACFNHVHRLYPGIIVMQNLDCGV